MVTVVGILPEVIRARERMSFAAVLSEKNHPSLHMEEWGVGGRRGSAKHQDCSGNFLKLIFFNIEINKI